MIEKAHAFELNFLADIAGKQSKGEAGSLPLIFDRIINTVLWVAGALAIIYIIYSGILYITAAGNPDSAKKGQQGLVNGVIGIIIVVLAYYIATSIASYAGHNIGNMPAETATPTTTPTTTPVTPVVTPTPDDPPTTDPDNSTINPYDQPTDPTNP